MDQIKKIRLVDYIYGEFHAEQESEVRLSLSRPLSSLPGVLRYAFNAN